MNTATPPVFQALQFNDIDAFRQAVRKFRVDFTPLAREISVRQAILNLADFDLSLTQSFPRLADTELAADCTSICLSMEDNDLVRFNGIDVDRPMVAIGHGGDRFSTAEPAGTWLAAINFTPEIHDRGWPETGGHFSIYATTASAQQMLRMVISEIVRFASTSSEAVFVPGTSAALRESLLSVIDHVFEAADLSRSRRSLHSKRAFTIFQKIEAHLLEDLQSPIYSTALAGVVGVSIRTLQDVILQYRGMSLHRYLRLKRLWLVRKRLLAGGASVKACALEYGFWHLSDFSRSYHLHFGETPSQTLAKVR